MIPPTVPGSRKRPEEVFLLKGNWQPTMDEWKLVLSKERHQEALKESHDLPQVSHLCVEKIFYRVAVAYYWPRMFKDVVDYV